MKINVNAIETLQSAFAPVQERASVRTMNPEMLATRIENQLEPMLTAKGLPKKCWKGLRFIHNANAQTFPHAYKYSPEATLVTIERSSNDWFVTDVRRGYCTNKTWELVGKLTEEQEAAILKSFYKF